MQREFAIRPSRVMLTIVEVGLILAFAAWMCWDYLGGTPTSYMPDGSDFLVSIQGRFFWDRVKDCGTCALWNGDLAGGNPALIDTSSDFLHPLVAAPLLLWGTLEGSRIAVFLTVALGGLSSWWLAKVLGTSMVARLYAGALGVAGGHLMGRLDFGLVVLITSIATASLLLPAAILFSRTLNRRHTALFGLLLGLTVLSGQGYVQVGVALLAPAIAVLLLSQRSRWTTIVHRLVCAGVLGLLLSATFIVPFAHYRNLIDKEFDAYFTRTQSFSMVPLNLIVSSREYFSSALFETPGFPGWHVNYIGWIAVGFAVAGIPRLWRASRGECSFLILIAIGSLWLASAQLFEWLANHPPNDGVRDFVVRMRTPSNLANLAVPAIIGLAACGVDEVATWIGNATRFRLRLTGVPKLRTVSATLSLSLLVLLPVTLSVYDVQRSAREWQNFLDLDSGPWEDVVESVQEQELGWIEGRPLFRQLAMVALDRGLKIGNGWQPWRVDPQLFPQPAFWISNEGAPTGAVQVDSVDDLKVYAAQGGNPYASIALLTGHSTSCSANGRGADIEIRCPSIARGPLTIQERYLDGWTATVDDEPAEIVDRGGFIGLSLDEGANRIVLTYRSPHFLPSLVATAIGMVWAFWWIFLPSLGRAHSSPRRRKESSRPASVVEEH